MVFISAKCCSRNRSGSMSEQELTDALNETRHVMKTLNTPISFIACDAEAHIAKRVLIRGPSNLLVEEEPTCPYRSKPSRR